MPLGIGHCSVGIGNCSVGIDNCYVRIAHRSVGKELSLYTVGIRHCSAERWCRDKSLVSRDRLWLCKDR
jgi:hypothetical protein